MRLRRSFDNNNGNNSFSTTKYYFLDISFTTNFSTEEIPEELYAWTNSTTEVPHIALSGLKSNGKFKPTSFTSEDLGNGMYKTTVSFILNCSDNEFTILDSTNDKGDFNFIQIIDDDNNTCLFGSNEVISITFNNIFYKDATTIKATDDLKFFISLDNIMSSELSIDENNVIKINKLPVVHTSFFKSSNLEERKEGFIQQLFTYINKLQESSDLLETSTNFNLKFFNTYGSSHLYNTPTTNLKIDMEIVLNEDYVNNTELQNEIRSYIRRLVDVMNTNLGYIDLYKIITILYDTEVYGNYIKNIRYAAGSESLIATIDPIKFKDEKDKEQYVPEWLNLDAEYLTTGITFK